jgi:S-DNA-T family DNA segregation ATPase FtsK/SpoIIIE
LHTPNGTNPHEHEDIIDAEIITDDSGADVVDLTALRQRRPDNHPDNEPATRPDAGAEEEPDILGDLSSPAPATRPDNRPDTGPDTGEDTEPDTGTDDDPDSDGPDAETVEARGRRIGGPVDPDDDDLPPSARRRSVKDRPPVIPPVLKSVKAAKSAAVVEAKYAGYVTAYHAIRSLKYAGKVAIWAPRGAARAVTRLLWWAMAEEGNWNLRQHAADRNDAETWLRLDRQRQRQTVWRWWVTGFAFVAAIVGTLVLVYGPVPLWVQVAVMALVLPLAARLGRPADKRIVDRVSQEQTYRKLTAELVRRALMSLQLAGITSAVSKDPHAISFPTEIHRDGPGHLAIVDLPYGVEAAEVIARRGKLASALRLPLDQVWPEAAPGHTGRLALWVGHEPASAMRQPKWPLLAKDATVDVFKAFPVATTPRLDVVDAELMFRNWLIGGQPGSGKTFLLRNLVLAATLDPRTEIRGYGLKGVGDFTTIQPVCTEFGEGADDETLTACAAMIEWLYTECQRRAKRISHYASLGKAPENKVTPELASLKGSGLHPLVVWIDEIQELFTSPIGKDAKVTLEKVIKLGRALGIILIIGTQIPDKDSLPPGITRNVNTRFCMSVADQVANDMILGTSAYKLGLRATVFEPVVEAGWGIVRGLGKPGARRSFYADTKDAARLITRAVELRTGAGTRPAAPVDRQAEVTFDLLADLLQVWPKGEDRVWNEALLPLLGELRPQIYPDWKPETLTAALKPLGVEVGQILRRVDGKAVNRRGPARDDIHAAITQRERRRAAE